MNIRNDERVRYRKAVIRRRRAEVRRQKLILSGVIIAAVLMLTFFVGARLTFAKSVSNNIKRVKCYKAVMIGCGDSLDKIAGNMYTDDFPDVFSFEHEINVINHLDEEEELIAGNYLTIPYYKDVITE